MDRATSQLTEDLLKTEDLDDTGFLRWKRPGRVSFQRLENHCWVQFLGLPHWCVSEGSPERPTAPSGQNALTALSLHPSPFVYRNLEG